ncbi:Phosphorylase superfamily [Carpediemonas membranifera]|uniref:Phosphorylase superfamily n=1 Tax=Carpediemonas membranifera TaxID=201153 RepID=A0A8J6DX76_9EUKA|nr:Phosphorylase superfamily [Carpediemonas membranifera]|eukprot:KAG9389514.1 Phosphorylase superfamily [Carpediemonas membranifera]
MPFHIKANPEDIAPIVFLPGDPDRAKYIAENFFEDAKCYNTYRHLYGYTGMYKGHRVSIQTTGMGCPSASIVVNELIQLGAKVLIRIGTAGIVSRDVLPGDLIIATGSCPNEGTSTQMLQGAAFAPVASFNVVQACNEVAVKSPFSRTNMDGSTEEAKVHVGLIQSEDAFYATNKGHVAGLDKLGVLAVEMEASALFLLGNLHRVQKGCIVVASNYIEDAAVVPDFLMKQAVDHMATVSLDAAVLMYERGQDKLKTC